uniref:Uncharacterized protein LOC104221747 n=1 Tax=Nicotiana sylvestris TaxID=4096 RepID=A0A1U7W941_NICSY|nr:PREDICTED: uncharacterized protein LOC104221747 [Nicotiana sylvestris]
MWGSSVPLFCLDIVEHHVTERVLCQFGNPHIVPTSTTWETTHYKRDDCTRVDDQYLAWIQDQIFTWDQRFHLIPPPFTKSQDTEHDYMPWYRGVTRLFVGNPIHRAGSRHVPYAGRHEALAIGLHLVHQLGLQMQQHAGDPAIALQEYGRQITELAARTLHRAREDERLEYVPAFVAPEHYHQGMPISRARGRRGRVVPRGRAIPRGRGGHRGGGPQQGGVEVP